MKRGNLFLLPIVNKVVFPYQSIRIRISDPKFNSKVYNNTLGVVAVIDELENKGNIYDGNVPNG